MAHHQAYGSYGDFSCGDDDHSSPSSAGMQGFETTNHHGIFELQAGMEMLSMPSKHFFHKPPEGASSGSSPHLNMIENTWQQPNRLLVDDPSLRCLFPPTQNHVVNQSLSLSLPHHHDHHHQQQHQQQQQQQVFYQTYQLKSSMYLIPAQQLLTEFCNLGSSTSPRQKAQKSKNKEGDTSNSSSSPSWNQSALLSMDILELQKRKARLLSILEEVDRRYRRYCEQMRAVVSSFEAVAGRGSATVYSALASKTISRHFRSVRDGIVSQIQATKKAMGEKDPVAPGTTKGETPRLKLVDQCLRQQKCFQQGGSLESHPWRPQRGLPERSVSILRAWLFEHFLHPYPSDVDKHILARQTGLSRSQVSNWFINARVRLWKPMVEEMYLEETKERDGNQAAAAAGCESSDNSGQQPDRNPNPSSLINSHNLQVDQKPQILHHVDSDSLTSIVNSRGPRAENFGVVDLDFASYNQECSGGQNFGNGVSLTLGLQQHAAGGMSLSFSPTGNAHQQSVFYARGEMDDCQPVQFSILDGEQGQNLPYRNLMGAQLLHDLAG